MMIFLSKSKISEHSISSHSSSTNFLKSVICFRDEHRGIIHGGKGIGSHIRGIDNIRIHSLRDLIDSMSFNGTGVNS